MNRTKKVLFWISSVIVIAALVVTMICSIIAAVAAPVQSISNAIGSFFNTISNVDYLTTFGCTKDDFQKYESEWQQNDLDEFLKYPSEDYGYKYEAASVSLFYSAAHHGAKVTDIGSMNDYMASFKGTYSSSADDPWFVPVVGYLKWGIRGDVNNSSALDTYNCIHRLADKMRAAGEGTSYGIDGAASVAEIENLGDNTYYPGTSSQCSTWWDRIHADIFANNLSYWSEDPRTCTNFAHWRFWLQYGMDAGSGNGDQMASNTVAMYPDRFELVDYPVAGSIVSTMGYNHVQWIEKVEGDYLWFSDGNVSGGGIRFNTRKRISDYITENGGIQCAAPIHS
jgi:hypothetical protein